MLLQIKSLWATDCKILYGALHSAPHKDQWHNNSSTTVSFYFADPQLSSSHFPLKFYFSEWGRNMASIVLVQFMVLIVSRLALAYTVKIRWHKYHENRVVTPLCSVHCVPRTRSGAHPDRIASLPQGTVYCNMFTSLKKSPWIFIIPGVLLMFINS